VKIDGQWVADGMAQTELGFTHGLCPECYEQYLAEIDAEYATAQRESAVRMLEDWSSKRLSLPTIVAQRESAVTML